MSDLQLSLLIIGALVVCAVFLYNWLQERRLRHRLTQAFGETRDDVLLRTEFTSTLSNERLEPQLVPAAAPVRREEAGAVSPNRPADADQAAAGFDSVLDYVAEITADAAIADN